MSLRLRQPLLALACLGALSAHAAPTDLKTRIDTLVEQDNAQMIELFKQLHRNPELAFQEKETAAQVAKALQAQGFEVKTAIGTTGVAGILRNGPGPVVMYRADMDALPIKEATGLPYASSKVTPWLGNPAQPVMHACGHDAHTTWLIEVAKVMAQLKDQWSGTLVLVAQPAEELLEGATAMVDNGLYDFVPKPDVLVAAHVSPVYPADSVGLREGPRLAGTDQIDVELPGIGGHGSTPHVTKDPVVMGAMAVLGYQTIISRMVDQSKPAVLTVGAFQAGVNNNIIPVGATLKLNLRWYDEQVRERLIAGIKSVTQGVLVMNDMPADYQAKYTMKGHATPVVNGKAQTELAQAALVQQLGADKVLPGMPPLMGSEDFHMLASPYPGTQVLFIEVGSGKPDVYKNLVEKKQLPAAMNHTPGFVVELPAIATGVRAVSATLTAFFKTPR
ncbi:amidohydrolase [Pseudomonas sp. BJa5]|uniref:amidohydrolase n=1 Tax=Pseudomonas sp. BJa5 TaxID=2936270 RepID=UPI002559552D|nr:amidohydrolase [Pseudomonas sp. BGr12]MDL2420785.1 amidohydrolase [Pseudomonas sp. BGr12]